MSASHPCVWCGATPSTHEHVLRREWRNDFVVAAPQDAMGYRWGTAANGKSFTHPQLPFDLQVQRACAGCNNGWMNSLDTAVQPHLFAVGLAQSPWLSALAALTWRRWALKTAVMRALMDNGPESFTSSELDAIRAGDVDALEHWHVLVGRADRPVYLHAACGSQHFTAPSAPVYRRGAEGSAFGISQTSWGLGYAVSVAVRAVDTAEAVQALGFDAFSSFKAANERNGSPLVELRDSPVDLTFRPLLRAALLPQLFWFCDHRSNVGDDLVPQAVRLASGRRRAPVKRNRKKQ